MTVNVTGSFRDQVQENGDIQSVLRGRNLIFGSGIEGLLLTIGRATATFTLPTEQEPEGTRRAAWPSSASVPAQPTKS